MALTGGAGKICAFIAECDYLIVGVCLKRISPVEVVKEGIKFSFDGCDPASSEGCVGRPGACVGRGRWAAMASRVNTIKKNISAQGGKLFFRTSDLNLCIALVNGSAVAMIFIR